MYNATKVKVSWAQANKSSSTTVYYQFDGSGDFTSLSTCSGPNANFESAELSVANHTTIALKFTHPQSNSTNTRIDKLTLKVTAISAPSGTTEAPTISGNTPFLDNTTVTITNAGSADGADIYYTLNGDDPTTTTSATCFAYSAPFTVSATTTVKAIAKKSTDTNASSVVSKTFTKIVPMTVGEALTAIAALANNGTIANQYVSGIVCTAGSLSSGAITYYISADGTETNRLQVYKGKGLNNANFADASDIAVGDEVVVFGTLKNFNGTTPEFDQGSYLLSHTTKENPNFSLDITEKTLDAYSKESVDVTLNTNTDGPISCESNDVDVATVAKKSDKVYTITAKSEGTATITIRSAASATYKPASATVAITVTDTRADAGISFEEDEEETTWGESYTTQTLTNTDSVAVTWSSTDETVATVNSSTGAITILKAGETDIKATFAGNATYKAAVASYTLTVNKAEAGLSYTTTSFDIMLNDGSFVAPTLNNPNSLTVTYTSSNGSVALVNENTGVLDYKATAEGTATITATFAGNDCYKSGSANYTINNIDPTVKGSKYNPYTVAEVIDGTATGNDKYVKGFIVGSYGSGSKSNFARSGVSNANLALADNPDEEIVNNTVALQLPSGTIRTGFNTQNKPYNIGVAQVVVRGDIDSYITTKGVRNTDSCVKVAEQVKIGSAGMATYYTDAALDYTGLTDMYAYTATVSGDAITFTHINKVPASQGVLLRNPAEAETTQLVPVVNGEAETVTENKFKGTLTDMAALTGENYYILNNGANGLGFYKVKSTGSKVAAHRAYLDASGVSARTFISVDGDTTTGIEAIENVQDVLNGNIFDLQGRRVNVPTKGLYIMNGKKVLFK